MDGLREQKILPPFLNAEEKRRFEEVRETEFIEPERFNKINGYLIPSGICFQLGRVFLSTTYCRAYPAYRYALQCLYNFIKKDTYKVDVPCYFVHTAWSVVNYHHWLVDSLPRFLPFLPEKHQLVLLLPDVLKEVAFVRESLHLLGIEKVTYVPHTSVCKVRQLHFSEQTPGDYVITSHLKPLVALLKERAHPATTSKPFRNVFLSRQATGYRVLENYDEVKVTLQKWDIEIVEAERLSFVEQIKLFSETKCLLSVHGAGLTNCIFMPKNGKVVELHPDINTKGTILNHCYWSLAHHFGLAYFFLGCEPVNKHERFHTANLIVDIPKLEQILQEAL